MKTLNTKIDDEIYTHVNIIIIYKKSNTGYKYVFNCI